VGFSVSAASTVILIGLITFVSVTAASLLYSLNQLTLLLNKSVKQDIGVQIELQIVSINASSIEFYVRNTGSKTIFFKNQGFNWNSVVVAYRNNSWFSYLIEDYVISEVRVQNTNLTFSVATHTYVNPGEEAKITLSLPSDVPLIPINETVIIVFISHYGVSTMIEGVRTG